MQQIAHFMLSTIGSRIPTVELYPMLTPELFFTVLMAIVLLLFFKNRELRQEQFDSE